MRKFIVSDLHGNGEVYDSIMGYLENIALVDDVELYINGDLIDRGLDGYRMLEDVKERIEGKGSIKINYLGGNHELMMYQALMKRKPGKAISHWCDWMNNGGWVIEGELDAAEDGEEKMEEYKSFLGNLDIYKKFDEVVAGNNLLLVHAQAPKEVKDVCDMRISDDNRAVDKAVWTRKEERESLLFGIGDIIGYNRIGLDGYLTIIGHTPLKNPRGFIYNSKENYFNIDGGCAGYAIGRFDDYDHVPLVEVEDGKLTFLTFNHNNEIIDGYSYDGNLIKLSEGELDKTRLFIDHTYDNCGEKNKQLIKEIMEDM